MTGLADFSTSTSKVASVTALVAPTCGTPSSSHVRPAPCAAGSIDRVQAGPARNSKTSSFLVVGQPALGVQRSGAAGARGRHGLAVDAVDNVAGCEDAIDRGAGGRMRNQDVPIGVRG